MAEGVRRSRCRRRRPRRCGGQAGDEAAVICSNDLAIEPGEQRCGSKIFGGQGAESADGERTCHGSLHAFAADIADDDQRRSVRLIKDLIEIPADLLSREVCRFDRVASIYGSEAGTSWR